MIVRILGEGQYASPTTERDALDGTGLEGRRRASTAGTRRPSPPPWPRSSPRSAGSASPWPTTPSPPPTWWCPFPDATLAETKALLADPADGPKADEPEAPMSTARNIPNDRGLTLRMFTTGLMLVLLYGAVIGLLIALGISYAVVLVFAAAILFAQYWFSDKIALYGMGGHIVTPEQAPSSTGPSTGSAPWPT